MASKEKRVGLSSQEAHQRLQKELSALMSSSIAINWLKEIKKNPCTIACNCMILIAGLILGIYFAVTADEVNGVVLFQSLFLVFLAAFNMSLFGWETYLLKTQKVRHLIARLKPVFDISCPWTSSDYPRSAISTLRGHLTVPAYRDGVLVNVPISLLVHGDLIELQANVPCPANAMLLESNTRTGTRHIAANSVPPEELFEGKDGEHKEDSVSFMSKVKPMQLVVEESPILDMLGSSLRRGNTNSHLTKETYCAIRMILISMGIVYITSVVVNIIRYFTLRNDFDDSWPELILGIPVYTTLPLLLLQLPLVWSVVNLYGTARITQLVDRGPLCCQASCWKKMIVSFQTLWVMIKLVFWCSNYPDYRVFHLLGSLTSVCAVDKEYLLTGGYPSPEKIYFLRTEDIPDEKEKEFPSTKKPSFRTPTEVGSNLEPVAENLNVSFGTVALHISDSSKVEYKVTGCADVDIIEQEVAESDKVQFQVGTGPTSPETEVDSVPTFLTHQSSQVDSASAVSTYSDSAPFELVTEILNISPDLTSYSGIAFDDVNWQAHIGSLKPIGVNLLATSHLAIPSYHSSPSGGYQELQMHLHKSSCSCSLGVEIGVSEYFSSNFKKEVLLYSVSNSSFDFHRTTHLKSTGTFVADNSILEPHILSTIVRDFGSGKNLVMSRGSGDLIASCCSDFWDGKELQPMTEIERASIVDYFNCRSISSYCIALSYNPLLDVSTSLLPWNEIGIYIPSSHLERNQSDLSLTMALRENEVQLSTAEQVFKSVQCGQVFLGLVCLQFRPKQDMVSLIEDLYTAGIRFVHFTAENELRGKIFAQKLGLEADWNCFISLAPSLEENKALLDNESEFGSRDSSLSSSVLSVYNATMSNIRARLPKGIKNIRPHIKQVDNVPLLVSLFTDCTAETITEMIEIMQENAEVVLCMGNAWNHKNIDIFSQADISMSLIPECLDLTNCTVTETCALSTSNSSQNAGAISHEKVWPSPLELASYLNSTSCQLCFNRDSDVSFLSLVSESRRILSSIRLALLFGLSASLSLSVMMLLSSLFFLPPPLSGSQLLWFLVFMIPVMMLTFLATPPDQKALSLMPDKKKSMFSDKWLITADFVFLFMSTGAILVLLFGLTLKEICTEDIANSSCNDFLGNRNETSGSPWNGWRGNSQQGLLFAQNLVAFFTSLYLVALSIRYIHRTHPIWKLWRFISWQYVVVMLGVFLLQITYFAVSQSIDVHRLELTVISGPSSVPVSVWCIGFIWPIIIIPLLEILKYVDKRKFFAVQTLLRLQFGTKLGMHSPV